MEKINIQVNTAGEVGFLTNYATTNGINGYVEGNHSQVNMNSILGWFSLDLSKPQTLILESPSKDVEMFSRALDEYGIKHEFIPA